MDDSPTGCNGPADVIPNFAKTYDKNLETLASIGCSLMQKAAEEDSEGSEALLEQVKRLLRVCINYDRLRPVIDFFIVLEKEQKSFDDPVVTRVKQLPLQSAYSC